MTAIFYVFFRKKAKRRVASQVFLTLMKGKFNGVEVWKGNLQAGNTPVYLQLLFYNRLFGLVSSLR